jgi:hypothetical protein
LEETVSDVGPEQAIWDHSRVVSVSFKPEALTGFQQWRWVLVRIGPRRRRPMLRVTFGIVYLMLAMPVLGFILAMAAWPNFEPVTVVLGFFVLSLFFPYRLWALKFAAMKQIRGLGPITVELDEEGVTQRMKNRRTRIDWPGVIEVRRNSQEVILLHQAGDLSWVPATAFTDPEHEARFMYLAEECLARSRRDGDSTPGRAAR